MADLALGLLDIYLHPHPEPCTYTAYLNPAPDPATARGDMTGDLVCASSLEGVWCKCRAVVHIEIKANISTGCDVTKQVGREKHHC